MGITSFNTLKYAPEEFTTDDVLEYLESKETLFHNYYFLPEKYRTQVFIQRIKDEVEEPTGILPIDMFSVAE